MERIKKLLLLLGFLPTTANAESILGPLAGSDAEPARTVEAVTELIIRLQNIVFAIAGGVAVAMIIWGAIVLLTSSGNEERTAKGKKILTYAIGGIILIVASYTLIRIFIEVLGGRVS